VSRNIFAVPFTGKPRVNFLSTANRDTAAVKNFFDRGMRQNDVFTTVTMDRSVANKTVIEEINDAAKIAITVRHAKYGNYLVEQNPVQSKV
jgi:transposase-like protein